MGTEVFHIEVVSATAINAVQVTGLSESNKPQSSFFALLVYTHTTRGIRNGSHREGFKVLTEYATASKIMDDNDEAPRHTAPPQPVQHPKKPVVNETSANSSKSSQSQPVTSQKGTVCRPPKPPAEQPEIADVEPNVVAPKLFIPTSGKQKTVKTVPQPNAEAHAPTLTSDAQTHTPKSEGISEELKENILALLKRHQQEMLPFSLEDLSVHVEIPLPPFERPNYEEDPRLFCVSDERLQAVSRAVFEAEEAAELACSIQPSEHLCPDVHPELFLKQTNPPELCKENHKQKHV